MSKSRLSIKDGWIYLDNHKIGNIQWSDDTINFIEALVDDRVVSKEYFYIEDPINIIDNIESLVNFKRFDKVSYRYE